MSEAGEKIEQRLAKALSHPVRMRVLTLLNQKVASPSELAEEIDEPLGNVSYHVRMLLDLELVELVGTTPRRGAVEHHYRAIERAWLGERVWDKLPSSVRGGQSGAVLTQAWEDTLAAVQAATFDSRTSRHLSRTPMVLDSRGWDELAELLDETLERATGIQTAAAERLAGSDDDSLEARLVLMHYQAAPREQPSKRGGRVSRRTKVSQPD
jgi:DNA-binding transcriptional ArsR family regulator